nr:PREDICTED: ATP synthase subunit e, mitochondrial [Struthio camelus australis]
MNLGFVCCFVSDVFGVCDGGWGCNDRGACLTAPVLVADYLKPIAEEERRVEAEEKKKREELERIARELAEASEDSILK